MSNLKQLTELQWKHDCSKTKMPAAYVPKTKFIEKTANGLTKAVIAWINLNGGFAERINTTGRMLDNSTIVKDALGINRKIGGTKWIKGTGTNGSADISATVNGKSWKIEIKIGKDKQSEAQIEYQKRTEASGGIYTIVKTFDEFYSQWETMTIANYNV